MRIAFLIRAFAAGLVLIAGCASQPKHAEPVKDGELALPNDYVRWPKFLSAVQRPDAKQVREIYMNNPAATATAALGFPEGSVLVMENYAAEQNADGSLKTGPDGKLVKGRLLRVFVMGKHTGWGRDVPPELRTGDWVYSSYLSDGQKSPDNLNTCRGCHVPLTAKDFVHRYDEHFALKR